MKHLCRVALLASITLMLSYPAMPQQAVAPPPKPPDEGPSLEVTMKFIQDRVNSIGPVNFVSYGHDGTTGHDWANQFHYETPKVDARQSSCIVSYHQKLVVGNEERYDKDFGIPLKAVENIIVMPEEQYLKEQDSANGHPSFSSRVDPPVFVLKAIRSDNTFNALFFPNEDLANRVAKAMVHAVELCGGGNKDPF